VKTKVTTSKSTDGDQLWLLLGKIHHKRMLVRQRELSPYNITARELLLLSIIHELGAKATLTTIAKKVERAVAMLTNLCYWSDCQVGNLVLQLLAPLELIQIVETDEYRYPE
jgi:hypothetical protein